MSEKTLSVFVDESGIWNESESSSRYYIVALVMHDQSIDVSQAIDSLDRDISHVSRVGGLLCPSVDGRARCARREAVGLCERKARTATQPQGPVHPPKILCDLCG